MVYKAQGEHAVKLQDPFEFGRERRTSQASTSSQVSGASSSYRSWAVLTYRDARWKKPL